MTSQDFLIAPYSDGMVKSLEPWLLPDGAFAELLDAYYYQGKIYKKRGYVHLGRLNYDPDILPEPLGNTNGTTAFTATAAQFPIAPGSVTVTIAALGMSFTDNGNGTLTEVNGVVNFHYGTVDYETGVIVLTFNPAAAVGNAITATYRVYDKEPVMGISLYENITINSEDMIAFDTNRAYEWDFTGNGFRDVSFYKMTAPANPVLWHGGDSDFFWTTNYYDVMWATNGDAGLNYRQVTNITRVANAVITVGAGHTFIVNDVVFINEVTGMTQINGLTGTVTAIAATTITVNINSAAFVAYAAGGYVFALTNDTEGINDSIKYYDGFGAGLGWRNFSPYLQEAVVAPTYLWGSKIMLPYKDRLLCLNTWEGTIAAGATQYPQRARWCQNGTPFYATDLIPTVAPSSRAGSQWAEDIPGKGGYIDAPTQEAIVSASYNKDTLLVFFERSTWQLRYTGSEVIPFVWEQIDSELGCESRFSPIRFDKTVLAIGDKAIISANSIGLNRIDEKIPFQVFEFENDSSGVKRVHGIRNFYIEYALWCYPEAGTLEFDQYSKFPNRVLAYNYREGTWAKYRDTFTCFGLWQKRVDYTWATLPYDSWAEWTAPWNSAVSQSYFPNIVAGNQSGHVLLLDDSSLQNGISQDLINGLATPSITAANPAVVQIFNHSLENGQFIEFHNTTAFPIAVVGEASGTAVAGSVAFYGQLDNLGVFPTSVTVTIGAVTLEDLGNGIMGTVAAGYAGAINYIDGVFALTYPVLGADTPVTVSYTYNDLNHRIFYVSVVNADSFQIYTIDANGDPQPYDATAYANYTGHGSISTLNNFEITTKRFNPLIGRAQNIRITYADLFFRRHR